MSVILELESEFYVRINFIQTITNYFDGIKAIESMEQLGVYHEVVASFQFVYIAH